MYEHCYKSNTGGYNDFIHSCYKLDAHDYKITVYMYSYFVLCYTVTYKEMDSAIVFRVVSLCKLKTQHVVTDCKDVTKLAQ